MQAQLVHEYNIIYNITKATEEKGFQVWLTNILL